MVTGPGTRVAARRGTELDAPAIFREVVKRTVPLGRAQIVEDIGHLAAFLASDAARNITG